MRSWGEGDIRVRHTLVHSPVFSCKLIGRDGDVEGALAFLRSPLGWRTHPVPITCMSARPTHAPSQRHLYVRQSTRKCGKADGTLPRNTSIRVLQHVCILILAFLYWYGAISTWSSKGRQVWDACQLRRTYWCLKLTCRLSSLLLHTCARHDLAHFYEFWHTLSGRDAK